MANVSSVILAPRTLSRKTQPISPRLTVHLAITLHLQVASHRFTGNGAHLKSDAKQTNSRQEIAFSAISTTYVVITTQIAVTTFPFDNHNYCGQLDESCGMGRTEEVEALKQAIGNAVAAARTSRGWSQEYVAKKLDVDSETISRIERGASIRLERLLELAHLYKVPMATFFHDAPGPKMAADNEIALAAGTLDAENQKWVLQMIKAVVKKFNR